MDTIHTKRNRKKKYLIFLKMTSKLVILVNMIWSHNSLTIQELIPNRAQDLPLNRIKVLETLNKTSSSMHLTRQSRSLQINNMFLVIPIHFLISHLQLSQWQNLLLNKISLTIWFSNKRSDLV